MTCRDIIKQHLDENGYQGLYGDKVSCCCRFADDDCWCHYKNILDCSPGYLQTNGRIRPSKPDEQRKEGCAP